MPFKKWGLAQLTAGREHFPGFMHSKLTYHKSKRTNHESIKHKAKDKDEQKLKINLVGLYLSKMHKNIISIF